MQEEVMLVHEFMASLFIGPKVPGLEVCHGDGNPLNNLPSNLRRDTRKGNRADDIKNGKTSRGTKSHHAKLTESRVHCMRKEAFEHGFSIMEIADIYEVDASTAWSALCGDTWKHVSGPLMKVRKYAHDPYTGNRISPAFRKIVMQSFK